jgi:putative tricarboxylic transport membrane protein
VGPWDSLLYGFSICFQPDNLVFCLVGVLVGTLIGVLPGVGPLATISMLLPATFKITPVGAVIMLAGIYYGAMYGGSTTSILVNIPGETASVVTCLDGYQMARQGRAGPALGIAAFGSFIAGTFSVVALMLVAPPLAKAAIKFGPPEYFSLMFMGLVLIVNLAQGSTLKALLMGCVGLVLSLVGIDKVTGFERFTYQYDVLEDGLGLVPIAMGVFGIAEVLINIEESIGKREIFKTKLSNLFPNLKDWKESALPITRGTIFGFLLGVLPGGGHILASFASYAIEKRFSKHPEKFGNGAIEGVAGPESANNAGVGGQFIPMMALGLPTTPVMALMLGALVIFGLQPGPYLMARNPDFFWGVIASMYIGNMMLLVLNLPLIGMWVQVLRIPYPILFPLILLFCLIGTYSISNSRFDVFVLVIFGGIGYLMKKVGLEAAPMLLAMVLGPMLENSLRLSLVMSDRGFMIFVSRPISAVFLALPILLFSFNVIRWARRRNARSLAELPTAGDS